MVHRRTIVTGLGVLTTSVASMAAETLGSRTSKPLFGVIYADDYAIDPTGVTDSAPGLNLAIRDAIAQKKKLVVPSGLFLLNSPLLCYSLTSTFFSLQMEGQGGQWEGGLITSVGGVQLPNGPAFPNTTFYANYNNLPGIIINCARDVYLKDFCIVGKNLTGDIAPYPPTADPSQYVTGGCRDSRYSPYAGICIDPLTCATPPDGGYPGLTYPRGLNSGSDRILIEHVWIGNFVVGIMNGPGTANANGDVSTFRDVSISQVRVAYACGDSQARQITFIGGGIGQCHTCFDTLTYGNQVGPAPYVREVNIGDTYALMNFYGGCNASFTGLYCESLVTLGVFGGVPSAVYGPLSFVGCMIVLLNTTTYPNSSPPGHSPVVLLTGGPASFVSCQFCFSFVVIEAWNFVSGSAPIVFESCHFTGSREAHRIPPIGVTRGGAAVGVTLINCYINGAATGGQSQVISDDLFRYYANSMTYYGNNIGRLNATYNTHRVPDTTGNATYIYMPPGANVWNGSSIGITGITNLTLNSTTVTFTKTNASQYFCENDFLFWSMKPYLGKSYTSVIALKIPVGGISRNNVTANMLFSPLTYDIVANQPSSTTVNLYCSQWAPTQSLTCTTNTSTSLTNVSPANTLLAGDFIIGCGANGSDIPSSVGGGACRVVSTDGAGNVTISKAATGSHSGVGLRFGYLSPTTPAIMAVASLPPGVKGMRYFVNDALNPVFGSTVANGGVVTVPVYFDGSNWVVG